MPKTSPKTITTLERLLARTVLTLSGCMEWQGCTRVGSRAKPDCLPYGFLYVAEKFWSAHRYAWHLAHGPIPTGTCVLHRCDNPRCINPDHLFLGSKGDNNRDRSAKGRTVALSGEQHTQSKLTWEQVWVIRSRAASGESSWAIAKDYCVAHSTIKRIVSGKLWRVT